MLRTWYSIGAIVEANRILSHYSGVSVCRVGEQEECVHTVRNVTKVRCVLKPSYESRAKREELLGGNREVQEADTEVREQCLTLNTGGILITGRWAL